MFLIGNILILFGVVLSPITAAPHLQDNGYRDILVYIGHDVPDEDANTVVEMTKELLTVASEDMYYAMDTRAYIHEVTIVVPAHWTQEMIPDLNGVTVRGEIFQEADIQIGKQNKLRGEAPYTQQINGGCGAPENGQSGEPIQLSLEYLKGLYSKRDEMIVNYGPMGKLMVQEFAKYHHGIYEEYGYPGNENAIENAEHFPSLYLHSFKDKDGIKKMAAVPNYCADTNLTGQTRSYKVDGDQLAFEDCIINDETGEIESSSCYFHADASGQDSYSSIGSIQYTDDVTLFCDHTEYFPHNHEAPNMHNDYCEGATQMEVIESHREFADGNNPPNYIENTTPTFFTKRQEGARFVLVVDDSKSMRGSRLQHLKTTSIRWLTQLRPGTFVAVVRFGPTAILVHDWVDAQIGSASLINAIQNMQADRLGTNMASGLKKAEEMMTDPNSPLHAGVVMVVTDGEINEGTDVGDASVWEVFKRNSIRVVTILIGTKKNTDIEKLARETKGKVFTVRSDGSELDGPFDWASRTYIPPEVGDRYEWSVSDTVVTGRDLMICKHLTCANATVKIDDQTNKEVTVIIRLSQKNKTIDISEYIKYARVQDDDENPIDGYKFSIEKTTNQALLKHRKPEPGKYTVNVEFSKAVSMDFVASIKVTGHRSTPDSEPYTVECKYPTELKDGDNEKYIISGFVKQGQTTVKGATVYARISKAMEDDPSGTEESCIAQLLDDGMEQLSGDLIKFDGVHHHILDPRNCWNTPPKKGTRMQVMCTMISSKDTQVTDNDFFTKKKMDSRGVPMEPDAVTPYCCGTSNQTWFHNTAVEYVGRNTHNMSIKSELNVTEKDWLTADFGPPGRISDLRATRTGDQKSGIVKLMWTGAGADPAYGTPASYAVHYSTKRSNLYTKNLKMSSHVSSKMLTEGSLEPVPIGHEMSITVRIPDLEVPGTYHFAVRAVDPHGQEGKASNIASVNFHDGSPVVKDVSPHHVHGIHTTDAPLIERLRKRYKDERIVQGYLKKAAKTKQEVWEAENSVMEKRLRKRFGDNEKVMAKVINTIKTNPDQRNIYKKILL